MLAWETGSLLLQKLFPVMLTGSRAYGILPGMMLRKLIFFSIILLACPLPAMGTKDRPDAGKQDTDKLSFQIYGKDFLVCILLPDYWKVDMEYAVQNGYNGFFYVGQDADASPAYLFVMLYEKIPGKQFGHFVDSMTNSLREVQPLYSVEKTSSESFSTKMNSWDVDFYDVRIKQGHGRYQKIAYMTCASCSPGT